MDEHQVATLATIQASITALSVQSGRTDERLINIASALDRHMREEHQEFKDALAKVESIESSVAEIHAAARTTRTIAAIAASLAAAGAWAIDLFKVKQ